MEQIKKRSKRADATWRLMRRNIALYVFLVPAFLYIVLFCYVPMYGVQIAFRNFNFAGGVTGSPWVGLKWFQAFFRSPVSKNAILNTLYLSFYSLFAGFPMPVILALMLHNMPGLRFRRITQTVTYLPHFISTVVLVGMLSCFLSINAGFVNTIIAALGFDKMYFMGLPQYFRHVYVWSGVWQEAGWGSIIYIAALSGISPELHEAAMIDGADKLRRIWHIDLPGQFHAGGGDEPLPVRLAWPFRQTVRPHASADQPLPAQDQRAVLGPHRYPPGCGGQRVRRYVDYEKLSYKRAGLVGADGCQGRDDPN